MCYLCVYVQENCLQSLPPKAGGDTTTYVFMSGFSVRLEITTRQINKHTAFSVVSRMQTANDKALWVNKDISHRAFNALLPMGSDFVVFGVVVSCPKHIHFVAYL